jgi:hypothetical protein
MTAPAREDILAEAVDNSTRAVDAERRRHLVAEEIREQLRGRIPAEYAAIAAGVLGRSLVDTHVFCRLGMQHCPTGGGR